MRTRGSHVIVGPSLMSPSRFSNITIVVVEDHDDARRYLGLFLDGMGANVVVARNGFEGLESIKNNHPNLVLSALKCREWTVSSYCVKFEPLDPMPEAVCRLSL